MTRLRARSLGVPMLAALAVATFGCGESSVGGSPGATADDPMTADDPTGADMAAETAAESIAGEPADASTAETAEPPADGERDLSGWYVAEGHLGLHRLAWRPLDLDKVPRNREFELEVLVLRDELPVPGVRLQLSGWMPAHQHGLVQTPLVEELGDGAYEVTGMLFQMRGSWQLRFQLFAERTMETFTFELEL